MTRIGRFTHFARVVTIAIALAAALAVTPSFAQETLMFPPGVACDFGLTITDLGGGHTVDREFTDKDGNVVRILSAGTGSALTYENMDTGALLSSKSNGAGFHIKINPDGTQTVVLTGHTVLILFPTDVPAGPSTTLYVGRVVYTIDTNDVSTLQETSGISTDICAALSS